MMLSSMQNEKIRTKGIYTDSFFVYLNPDTKVDFSKIKRYNNTRKCTIFVKYFRVNDPPLSA